MKRGKKKKCKCRISGVRKKKEIERKVPRKKNQSVFFWMKILLSSCSLVGFYVSLQVKFTEKKMMKIFKVFFR